ncbi:hypothetical protein BSCG_01148 [Bacteroides sp. 2_2_4]|nr:hypothetical protein BSCG_01148 [Bacteroides sp. 2_2_4]
MDSVTMALDSKTLRLTLDEYKRFRVERRRNSQWHCCRNV